MASSFVSKEYRGVKNRNQVHNLAAEPRQIADHHKFVGVLD